MNATAERNGHCPVAVNLAHLKELRASGLSDATIEAAGLRTEIDPRRSAEMLGWEKPADRLGAALVIPYGNDFYRLKFSNPRRDKTTGKAVKYEQRKGGGNRAYVPPNSRDALQDVSLPLLFVEGEKKGLKGDQEGFHCVVTSGVWNWCKKRKRDDDGNALGDYELIDDLAAIAWKGRTVYIVFDSDAATNKKVQCAERALAKALTAVGADVRIVRLPEGPPGADGEPAKVGLDDFLVANTADDLRALLDEALPCDGKGSDRIPHPTDTANAEEFARQHADSLRHVGEWKKWLAWKRDRWKLDYSGATDRCAIATVRKMQRDAAVIEDKKLKEERFAHAVRSEDAKRLRAMVSIAASLRPFPTETAELDVDPFLLNCPNGTLDLRTGRLREHRRGDLITKLCPTPYLPGAECPTFIRLLTSIFPARSDAAEEPGDPELIGFVQRFLGSCCTAKVKEHLLFVAYGGGANGKSTLFGAVQHTLGTEYTLQAPPELLMAMRGEQHPTIKADLFGQRLVIVGETHEGGRLNEAAVKALTGGDRIRARRMKEDFWEFPPTHKLVIYTNHPPRIRGGDDGIWRRLRLVPFAVKFWDPDKPPTEGEDRREHLRQDKDLPAKLAAEAPGILAWMVRGCLDWQRSGLGEPPAVTEATNEYRSEQDLFTQFLAERCKTGSADYYRTRASALYAAFRQYAETSGEATILTQTDFGKRMGSVKGVERKTSNGTWYYGIGLVDLSADE